MSILMSKKSAPRWLGSLLVAVFGLACASAAGLRSADAARSPRREPLAARSGSLPLAFEPNLGQTDSRVKFMSRGDGYGLFLTPGEAVLKLRNGAPAVSPRLRAGRAGAVDPTWSVLRMQLKGNDPAARIAGQHRRSGHSNYLVGSDSTRWLNRVPHYGRVRYEQVYRGIDLVYYGKQGQLEYDFVVAPHADPGLIRLAFQGARTASIDAKGDLLLRTGAGIVRQHRPVVYQDFAGGRRSVSGKYALGPRNEIGFRVGAYDRSRPLVIDPVLVFSSFLGGSGQESATDVVVDPDGNIYITGMTASADFPVQGGVQGALSGSTDAFVTKVAADGTSLLFSTYLGGSDRENVDGSGNATGGIAIDTDRNVYVAGVTLSPDFPLVNPVQLANGGNGDAFMTKLTPDGGGPIASTYLGGSGEDVANDVTVDVGGRAYVVGETTSTNLTVINAFQRTYAGNRDGFFTRFNEAASGIQYATYLGGDDEDRIYAVALDASGSTYVTGITRSTNFPATSGAFQVASQGSSDAFLTKFSPVATNLAYSSYLGGSGENTGTGVAVDEFGSAFVAGFTTSTDFPTTVGAFDTTWNSGVSDGFVSKFSASGSALSYSTYVGGSGEDVVTRVGTSTPGNVSTPGSVKAYITGYTGSVNFPVLDPIRATTIGGLDVFVTKLAGVNTGLEYSTYLGGGADDIGTAIAVDATGQAYVVGVTRSSNYPFLRGFDNSLGGASDVFYTKLSSPPAGPTNLRLTASTPTSVDLAWDDNSDNETNFDIERRTPTTAFIVVNSVGTNSTTYQDTGLTAETTYIYRIRARNSRGTSPYSNALEVTTPPNPPAAPTGLTVSPISTTALRLRWTDNATNERNYLVERSTDGINFTQIVSLPSNDTVYTDTGLTPNRTYYYQVRASNAGGFSAYSNIASATTVDTPPNAPSGLTARPVSRNTIDLTWTDNSANEDGFRIERAPDGINFRHIGGVTAGVTTFSDVGLAPSTRFFYRVRAFNEGGFSLYSNVANATTLPNPPAEPSNLTARVVSQTQINLAWSDNSTDEDGFHIHQSTDGGQTYNQIATVTRNGTTYASTGLTANTTYRYRVTSFNAGGDSGPSNVVVAATLPNPPAAPSSLQITAESQSILRLDWADNSDDEAGFKIERSKDNGATFVQIATVSGNATTYQAIGLVANTRYDFRVRAFNGGGNSAYSNVAFGTTLPNRPLAPTNLTATLNTPPTSITLRWTDNSTNETGFEVERSDNGGSTYALLATVGVNVTTYTDSSLGPDEVFLYRVRAVNSGGGSFYSNTARAGTPPAAPSGLTTSGITNTQIRLFWVDNSSTETSFKIERRTGTGAFGEIASVAAGTTTYLNTGLTPSTTYSFRVRAQNGVGFSPYSNTASGTTLPNPPAAPSGLTATGISQSSIRLNWADNSSNETGFEIERSDDNGATFAPIGTAGANATTFTDSGLATATSYRYRVRATNAGGNSAYATATGSTLPAAPAAPSGLSLTIVSGTQIDLDWTDNADNETSFKIERKTGLGSFVQIATRGANTESFSDTGVAANTTYTYRVRASNSGGDSDYSEEVSTTTVPSAPTGLTATAASSSEIDLAWSHSGGADGFRVERRTGSGSFAEIASLGASARSYQDSGLLAGSTFVYRVFARNAGGDSAPSNTATATTNTTLSTLSVSPISIKGGGSVTGTIRLQGVAPAGGAAVAITSSSSSAIVPSPVTVPAGQSETTFTIRTRSVSSSRTVTITGTYGGVQRSANLTITR